MEPINLKNLFGDRFKTGLDPAAYLEVGGKKNPWYFVILCKHGEIYPCSDKLLAFHCYAKGCRTTLHRYHPEIEVRNWSDDGEAIFIFSLDQFETIAKYARPRKKRKASSEERQRLAELTLKHSPFASINRGKRPQDKRSRSKPGIGSTLVNSAQ